MVYKGIDSYMQTQKDERIASDRTRGRVVDIYKTNNLPRQLRVLSLTNRMKSHSKYTSQLSDTLHMTQHGGNAQL